MEEAHDDERVPVRLQATFVPADRAAGGGRLALWGTTDPEAAASALGFPTGDTSTLTTVLPRTPRAYRRVAFADVAATSLDLMEAVGALVALDLDAVPAWRAPGPSVRVWRQAALLACEAVAAGRLVPALAPDPGAGDGFVAHWRAAVADDARVARLAAAMPVAAHATPSGDRHVHGARQVLGLFLDAVADALVRRSSDAASASAPATPLGRALLGPDPVWHGPPVGHLPVTLARSLDSWAVPVLPGGEAAARLCVRLSTPVAQPVPDHAPDPGAGPDPGNGPDPDDDVGDRWPLEYLLQATHDPSLVFDAAQVWDTAGPSLADTAMPGAQEALVRGLGEAARLFPPIDASLSEPRPTSLDLTAAQAAALLTDGAEALTAAGLGVQLPAELTRGGQARLRARLRVGRSASTPGSGGPGGLDMARLGAFEWEVAIEGEAISADEFAELAAHKRALVRWRGRWVHVDPDELDQLATAIGSDGLLDPSAALAGLLAGEVDDDHLGTVEVVAGEDAADLLSRLAGADPPAPRLDGIRATLRPYQHRGVAWLQARADLGLGSVLADDMGLGKTLQSIALIAGRPGDLPHLVVCPASVVGNWEREIARFAPALDVLRHHGPSRPDEPGDFPAGGITVTTYGTLRSDAALLAAVDWDVVVLDEAQAFKNHTTRTARAVRGLPAAVKVAMTGTPVENRLAELWAIMDVAVPGLLGGFTAFDRGLARPIERWGDRDATARLRRLTSPFVLRRTKRDPAIAVDLPPKQEQDVPVPLTAEQATLYQAVVDETFAEDLGEGIERRGAVLKLLTALKQVCNHPAQYLGQSGPLVGRSGKLVRATELLAEVVDGGDRALVFTQYRRMGDLLTRHLAEALDLPDVPFLHGGTTLRRRDELVDAFQLDDTASPLLLVSLKAGGTGLNLTRATHVVHYDRWWNPAVEDQATDRAYRIGQDRTVFVHKLTTIGTLEERIADLLERKRGLAEAVVGSGEAWLTELDDDQLRELVALDSAGVGAAIGVEDDVGDGPDDGRDDGLDGGLGGGAVDGARSR